MSASSNTGTSHGLRCLAPAVREWLLDVHREPIESSSICGALSRCVSNLHASHFMLTPLLVSAFRFECMVGESVGVTIEVPYLTREFAEGAAPAPAAPAAAAASDAAAEEKAARLRAMQERLAEWQAQQAAQKQQQ